MVKLSNGLDTEVGTDKFYIPLFIMTIFIITDSLIEMDTLRTQRARKLTEYYKKLQQVSVTVQDRIRMLNAVTDILSNENSNQIFELESLFQRERELLLCKLTDDSLDVLRRRQLVVFMDVIKDEGNNKPESKY